MRIFRLKRYSLAWGGVVAGVLLALFLLGSQGANAAVPEETPTSDEECLSCHSEVDPAPLARSAHKTLTCAECHVGTTEAPHEEILPPVPCQKCHAKASRVFATSVHAPADAEVECQSCHGGHEVKPAAKLAAVPCRDCHDSVARAYLGSVHARALAKGIQDAALCYDCHGKAHRLRSHLDSASPTFHARMAETCGHCHADRALVERRRIPIPHAYQLYQKSVHARAVAAGKPAATCNDCHESHDLRRANDPRSSIYRENIPRTCGNCHRKEAMAYRETVHGVAMANGVTKSPVCTDCHGEHSIAAARDPTSRVSVAAVSKTCSNCHEAQGINEKYGIPGGRLETYAESFHGLAVRGGSKLAANCASCHGVHDIRSSQDPKSAIYPDNLPATCGKCHPGAGENFAKGRVHVSVTAREEPILFYVRTFYLLLIAVTVCGMSFHNGLDFFRKLRREYRRRAGAATSQEREFNETLRRPQRWVERMTLSERWQHGLLAVSFAVLVYTGFALKFPDAWPFAWIVALEKGYALRSWIHRGAALVMVFTCLLHLVYLPTRRGRSFLLHIRPRYQDVKEAVLNIGYLLGLRAAPPRFDRFSYIEKVEYWAVVWGSVIMAGTGFMLWFENLTLKFLAKWVTDLATMVHYYEAWLASLAILIWHFYSVIFNPDVYPMNWTWLTGKISEEMLRHEHPLEHERMRQRGEL